MKVSSLSGHPRADVALEHDTVTRIEEHLCCATRRLRVSILFVALVGQTNVANSLSHTVQLPRLSSHLVVNGRTEVPGDFRLKLVQLSCRFPRLVQEFSV